MVKEKIQSILKDQLKIEDSVSGLGAAVMRRRRRALCGTRMF